MPLIPTKKSEKIGFFSSRITLWTTNATAIGTTSAAVTALSTAASAAATALAAQETAQNAAKAATETLDLALSNMVNQGMAIIEQVRTKARSAGDGVYPLANIPAPATPSTSPPPGQPKALKTTLNPNGSLLLNFKCKNPVGTQGTLYHVYRSLTGEPGTYEFLGGSGKTEFLDATCPAGVPMVYYSVQAVRSTAYGVTAEFVVKFGSASTTTTTAKVYSSPKIAA